MSKDYTFNPGDFVVYPTHGVGQVKGIVHIPNYGDREFIQIDFQKKSKFNPCKSSVFVDVNNVATNGLRQLVSSTQMDAAIHILKGKAKRNPKLQWNKRQKEYRSKIDSGDLSSIAEVVRDLYRHPDSEKKRNSEREVYEDAMDRFASEYAALNKIDESDAITKLESILQSKYTPKSSL